MKNNMQQDKASSNTTSFEEAFFLSNETYIHPTAIIGSNVTLETGVKIGPHVTIIGNVSIGKNTRIHGYTMIGPPALVVGMKQMLGSIEIGNNTEIRQFVSVHSSRDENGKTIIGNDCYIMNYCHVAHDSVLEDHVTLINSVNLGGHTHIEHHAMMMANSATHQFCRVGAFAALAPFSGIRQDIPPFGIYDGRPARFNGINRVALKRAGIPTESINNIKSIAKLFYQKKMLIDSIKKEAQELWPTDKYVSSFIQFIENSDRGISRKSVLDK
jgi:UDP-N-acetylglucosamine acyltransferase